MAQPFTIIPFIDWSNLNKTEVFSGFIGSFAHTEQMTISHWDIAEGSILPEHSHPHEQISNVIEGSFELTIQGETQILTAGKAALIPSHAVHSGRALTKCKIIDIFCPVREDYLKYE
jgi:quercetin dioxygenase-like cupin family protein